MIYRIISEIIIAILLVFGGYMYHDVVNQTKDLTCNTYHTKNGVAWEGYAAHYGELTRCFFVESAYPWRVRHGVAANDR
jgi:hypothetical protein